jgi:Flp pilus assembly protein TadD
VTGVVVAAIVLGLPYLSVREVSVASNLRQSNPTQALQDLSTAAEVNPLSAEPGRVGGTIALQSGRYLEAEQRFGQAASREPGGWYAWLGRGLAASALGHSSVAHHDFEVAASINRRQPVVQEALARVHTAHPLAPEAALVMLAQSEAT